MSWMRRQCHIWEMIRQGWPATVCSSELSRWTHSSCCVVRLLLFMALRSLSSIVFGGASRVTHMIVHPLT